MYAASAACDSLCMHLHGGYDFGKAVHAQDQRRIYDAENTGI